MVPLESRNHKIAQAVVLVMESKRYILTNQRSVAEEQGRETKKAALLVIETHIYRYLSIGFKSEIFRQITLDSGIEPPIGQNSPPEQQLQTKTVIVEN